MAKGKVNLYGLGTAGVNVVKSPIHLDDHELTKAQNAVPDRASGLGSLRKRDGLVQYNSSALDGKVWGLVQVPLPAPNDRVLIFHHGVMNPARRSVDLGATWANVTLSPDTGFTGIHRDVNLSSYFINPSHTLNGYAYIPGGLLGNQLLAVDRDGRIYVSTVFPSTNFLEAVFQVGDLLYVSVRGSSVSNRLYQYDPRTNAQTVIAPTTSFTAGTENIFCGCEFAGDLWIGTSRASQGRIHTARANATAWTVDHTAAAGLHTYTSVAVYKGFLYATTAAAAGTAALIERRTPGGTWSTSLTSPHSAQANYFDGLFVHNAELFAFHITRGGTNICNVYKFDGTSWVIDEDLSAGFGARFVTGVNQANGNLFVVVSDAAPTVSQVLKRTSAGVWSSVDSDSNFTFHFMVVI